MAKPLKILAKKLQGGLPFAIGKNEAYDRSTKLIITKHCKPDSICIDIGANEGKILEWMTRFCPAAKHFAFEPIPALFIALQHTYANRAWIYPIALSDQKTDCHFNYVTNNPALSGFRKRPSANENQLKQIKVQTDLLDHFIDPNVKIDLIKIDVEGAEFLVLRGAIKTINNSKPLILFECGKIGGKMYGFSSATIYQFFEQEINYQIFLLKDWLGDQSQLSYPQFDYFFETGKEYFFLAVPVDNPKKIN